jgi:hypothetical protein
MCSIEKSTTSDRMHFGMKELFIRKTYLACVMMLQWMSLKVAILSNRQDLTLLVIDDSRHVKLAFGQDLPIRFHDPKNVFVVSTSDIRHLMYRQVWI